MPLKRGFGYNTVQANIGLLMREGKSIFSATAIAMSHARMCLFKSHPTAALPEWLAYPINRRSRDHYTATGQPRYTASGRHTSEFKRNPAPSPDNMRRAAKLYRDFTGHTGARVLKIPVSAMPREGLVFGELLVIGYKSRRDGKPYAHEFSKKSRPLLVASHDGKQVVLVGGRYTFTDAGIEDR
jgi:hypothetical protein